MTGENHNDFDKIDGMPACSCSAHEWVCQGSPPKCANCHGNHPADSTNCPTNLKQVSTVSNARGIDTHIRSATDRKRRK